MFCLSLLESTYSNIPNRRTGTRSMPGMPVSPASSKFLLKSLPHSEHAHSSRGPRLSPNRRNLLGSPSERWPLAGAPDDTLGRDSCLRQYCVTFKYANRPHTYISQDFTSSARLLTFPGTRVSCTVLNEDLTPVSGYIEPEINFDEKNRRQDLNWGQVVR